MNLKENLGQGLKEWDVTMKMVGGKMVPVIKVKAETIIREDGSKDVIVQMPTLSLINKKLEI